jgi:hypothetical protein
MKEKILKMNRFVDADLKSKMKGILFIAVIFLFNAFLVMDKLLPALLEISPHDKAKYIESGRLLLEWGVRDLSWGPLVAFVYAPLHLFVGNSPNWFLLEAWGGNIILYGLLWFGMFSLAQHLKKYISSLVMIGLLFSLTVFFPIIGNQSDALFLFFSMMALLHLDRFKLQGELRYLRYASLFVGLGVLCRVETILLVVPLLAFAIIFNKKRNKFFHMLLSGVLPLAAVLLLYIILSLLTLGFVDFGVGNKSFASFQVNNAFLPGSQLEQAYKRGEEIFGDHQNSIFRAILNNPRAVGERILANILKLPQNFFYFFGDQQGAVVLFFSVLGVVALIKAKEYELLALLLVWPLHAFVALIFLPRHIVAQMSFIFIILAMIGITRVVLKPVRHRNLMILLLGAILMVIISGAAQNKVLFTLSLFLSLIFCIKLSIEHQMSTSEKWAQGALLVFLLIFMAFGQSFTFPARSVGKSPVEQAVRQLQLSYPDQTHLLSPMPIIPIAAKMDAVELPPSVNKTNEFLEFIENEEIAVIYLDDQIAYGSDVIAAALNKYPQNFLQVFESNDGSVRLYETILP